MAVRERSVLAHCCCVKPGIWGPAAGFLGQFDFKSTAYRNFIVPRGGGYLRYLPTIIFNNNRHETVSRRPSSKQGNEN